MFRQTYSNLGKDDFVGLNDDVESLVENLVSHDCKVVAICCLGGLGMTTLAKRIYHHHTVKIHFEAHVWICISQEWQPTNVLQAILVKLTPGGADDIYKERDIGRLINQISTILHVKKCLVVLDDVWHIDDADFIKSALLVENMSSKVLLTSRNINVARHMSPNAFVYEPPTLTDAECLELLERKIGTKINEQDVEKMKLAVEMIKECGGLPLALTILGGILGTKQSLVEWERVHLSIKSYIRRGEGIGQSGGGVSKILGLSYDDLPYQLKSCFLYLGQFKEDEEIETERLYRLWNAESMIMSEDRREGETMIDVAEGYLEELAQRYMVQVELAEEHIGVGRFKSCHLHDLMRDLSNSIGKQENFFHVYGDQHEKDEEVIESYLTNRTPRVVAYVSGNSSNFTLYEETCVSLRPLLLFISKDHNKSWMVKFNDFTMLRVLHIEGQNCAPDELAIIKVIGKLCHLRYYLNISDFELCMYPSYINKINKLKHLQTLYLPQFRMANVVSPCSNVLLNLCSNVLLNLSRLQHLHLSHKFLVDDIHVGTYKLNFDALIKLETLINFNNTWCDIKSVLKLTNLRKFTANLNTIEELESIIEYLNSRACKHMRHSCVNLFQKDSISGKGIPVFIEILRCSHLSSFTLALCEGLTRLPRYDEVGNFSQSLKTLTLMFVKIDEDPMPTLEKLPQLQVLMLCSSFTGKEMVCSKDGFPQLISLNIHNLGFEDWVVEEGAMPNLSCLVLYCCLNLKALPDGLRFITSLSRFTASSMSEEFNRRIKVVDGIEGEDFHIISHVSVCKII